MKINLGKIKVKNKINVGNIKLGIKKIYPALENLTVKPSSIEQTFKSEKYGYDKVTVEAVESEKLNIKPTLEEQKYVGVYGEVNVEPANDIYEKGNYDERVRFWDAWTDNGKRYDYGYGCYGWFGEAFYPTRDLGGTNMQRMFYMFKELDLAERCEECGIKIDCTNCSNTSYMFGSSEVTGVPHLEFTHRNMNKFDGVFNNCQNLKYIEKITLREDGTQTFLATTFNSKSLEEIRFEGVIGNDITFQSCTLLSKESLLNIISVLKDYSQDTSGTIRTLTIGPANIAKLTAEEIAVGTNKKWVIS